MAYIELNDVSVGFGSGTNRSEVLTDINLHMEKGEFVAILGYSGTGKSTIMNLIAGLVKPDKGEVIVDGKKVEGPSPDRGLVFQNYSLLPWFDVYKNVGLAVDEVYADESPETKDRLIREAIERVNLTDAAHKKPGELSGGMRQRNSVARTLSMNPAVLLLDEPLSALDALTRSVIQDEILGIWKELGQTIVLITNDVDEGLYMADRIIPLSVGPPATFGPETVVAKERPRDRRAITTGAEYHPLRQEIIEFLLNEKEKERSGSIRKAVSLPNISPMDISRHKPSWFLGLRPQPKKTINAA
ncbi:ABC transporter ATP-binding protein [Verrucomicrobiales bacterium BCK34]|nr:ABC transporter ATP-binding protein [Verrucomicrobiales bacterium BCK34]